MLIDLEDNKITIYYLKLKGKEYKLILEFPSSIINKKELYEKYDSTTSKKVINNKCFDTNCYRKKPIKKDRPDLFLITLPKFIYTEGMIIDCNIHDLNNHTPGKGSHWIYFNESNIIKLLIKGNKVGPTNFIMFFPSIDDEVFKEKTGYEDIFDMLSKESSFPSNNVQDLQTLYSVGILLEEKCYINYRIETA